MVLQPVGMSLIPMHAKDVLRMANDSIRKIDGLRRQAVNKVMEEALQATRPILFGLARKKIFRDRNDVMAHCELIDVAKNHCHGALDTCQTLQKLSERLLADESLTDQQRILYITLNDYRAIS